MTKDSEWSRSERLFSALSIPYPILSTLIGLIIYLIFILFDVILRNSVISQQRLIMFAEAIVISYLLIGYQFLLKEMKLILSDMSFLIGEKGDKNLIQSRKRFKKSYFYYFTIISIIFPFLLTNVNVNPLQYLENDMPLLFLFYVYTQIVGLVLLFLLGNMLWIIINISWGLNEMANDLVGLNTSVSLYSTSFKIKSIRSSITKVIFYYFIGITLLITTYLNPVSLGKFEIIILIIILLIGVALFFIGLDAIQAVLKTKLEYEIEPIDKKVQELIQKLFLITSEGDFNRIDELEFISNTLDVLKKQKDELTDIDTRVYDLSTITAFITSVLIPSIPLIDKIRPFIIDLISK